MVNFKKLLFVGIDLRKMYYNITGLLFIYKTYKLLKSQKKDNLFKFGKFFPILTDRIENAGILKGHYFHQDLYIARRIYENKPTRHIDIGSRTDGFVAHVASYRKIEILDIRPAETSIHNIHFKQADLTFLPSEFKNSTDSLSSLHAIEHFGLGRYGDNIDYYGYIKVLDNIYSMLKPSGKFYFSVPIGPQRIEFNAHRVFSVKYLIELFEKKYKIDGFSFVDDLGNFHENVILSNDKIEINFNCNYGCGIFEMTKK